MHNPSEQMILKTLRILARRIPARKEMSRFGTIPTLKLQIPNARIFELTWRNLGESSLILKSMPLGEPMISKTVMTLGTRNQALTMTNRDENTISVPTSILYIDRQEGTMSIPTACLRIMKMMSQVVKRTSAIRNCPNAGNPIPQARPLNG